MAVRAKFTVTEIQPHGETSTVRLCPVFPTYNPDGTKIDSENAKFYAATPAGELSLGGVTKAVADQFEPGREYFIDISPAG